ncbi:MAG: MBL fold metallo-hydrolase [Acidobacteria bacterium]|nr:MBL fold metallo-hydrolase [Acidobacteriota bacterium]
MKRLFAGLGAMTLAGAVAGATPQIGINTQAIGSRLLVFTPSDAGLGNSAAILGEDFVVVVDAPSPSLSAAALQEIRARTDRPVRYLVNTHWHDDHVWGNQIYADAFPELQVIAHPATRAGIEEQAIPALATNLERLRATVAARDLVLESGEEDGAALTDDRRSAIEARQGAFRQFINEMETIRPALPENLVDTSLTLDPGGGEVVLRHLGRGNTNGDLVVWDTASRILVSGDIVTSPIPAGGDVPPSEWDATLDAIVNLAPAAIVPGHGELMRDLDYVRLVRDLLAALRAEMTEAVGRGLARDDAIAAIQISVMRSRFTRGDQRLELGFDRFFLPYAAAAAYDELIAERR